MSPDSSAVADILQKDETQRERTSVNNLVVEEFKIGDPIYFGRGYNREADYSWQELHAAPNGQDYLEHLLSIPTTLRTDQEKRNIKLLQRRATTIHQGKEGVRIVNNWFKFCKRNDPCPCGSGLKWKKCHMLTMSPYVPLHKYAENTLNK